MSNLQKVSQRAHDGADRLAAPVGSLPVEIRADRKTAIQLLKACVRAEIKCLGEVLRYIGDNSARSRRLLEDVLSLEEEHAENLIGVLQVHRERTGVRGTACPATSLR